MNILALHNPSKSTTNPSTHTTLLFLSSYFKWHQCSKLRAEHCSSAPPFHICEGGSFSCDFITSWVCGRSDAFFSRKKRELTVSLWDEENMSLFPSPLFPPTEPTYCFLDQLEELHLTIVVQIVVWISWLTGLGGSCVNVWVAVGSHSSFELVPVITVIIKCTQLSLLAWSSASVT